MIKFPMFRRQYMAFRTSAFRTINNLKDLPELPYGSVLHILDLFKMNEPVRMAPALNNPLLNLNKDKLLICNITHPSQCDTGPAPIAINKMIMTNAGVLTALMTYRRQMGSRVFGKYFDSVKDLPIRPGAQAVVNYNSLFRARVMGQRRKVRFMNMLWGCIVNTIMQAQDRMHFIHVPLESLMFERQHFIRVFKKYDRVATKFPEISSYLFLAHLYAILMKNMSLPPRGVALDEEDATECFDVDPSVDNPDLVCEDFLANIKDTVLKDTETALEFIKTKDFENPYQVSIFEYLPARVFENVNFILTCGGQYIIYNLRDLKELNGNAGSGIMRIIRHVNMLAAAGEKTELPAEANDYMVGEEITEVDETGTKANQPEFVVPMTQEEKADAIEQDLKDLNDIDKILSQEFKTQKKPLTEAQKSHIEEIGVKYKQLELNGKSLATLLASVPENTAVVNIPSVKPQTPSETTGGSKPGKTETGKDTGIPMPTPANARAEATKLSSVAEMDTNYLKAQFDRDLASVLTFFNTKGMFLTDLKTEDKIDELNTHSKITAKYEDINHKKHTISFTIPKPNEFGVFLDNGNLKAMRKQRVSNPITKASDVRVTLNSNYNKLLVERNTNAAHNFENWFKNAVGKAREAGFKMMLVHGSCKYPDTALPYELTSLGSKYEKITFDNGGMFFDIPNRANNIPQEYREKMGNLEEGCGVWFGHRGDLQFFMTNKGLVQVKSYTDEEEVFYGAFLDFMEWLTEAKLPPMTEFCELTVLSRVVPVIHPLAYRYGLTNMLNYCGAKYELADRNAHVEQRLSDIVIKFKDKKLIIERTPRNLALLFGGLCIYDFSDVLYEDMDDKNVYYEMLSQKGVSTHLIKGIDSLFDLFIDPITKDILREMNEPTDIRDLLIRAVTLLTTSEHKNAASATNFRFRGFEQITGIIYNEMAKAFATYQNKMINGQNNFSMSEFQIKQRILHEQLMENVNTLNPIDDIKQYSKFSNSGSGGRSNDTFMIPDRNFTPDSVGIVSEATVDNGKTGLNAMLPFNPIIVNNRGMCTQADLEQLKPENMLSITSLLYPCVTHDDSKRACFTNIQASHYVPIVESDVSRVRTGFESVIAQRTTNPVFSYSAKQNGVVSEIDEENGVMVIQYADGSKVCLPFKSEYTNNSSNGFYVSQEITINGFRKGDKFKAGDILTYNKEYFQADPFTKQVNWKLGILAHVALMDNGGTIEDASILTQPLCDKMVFHPVHVKEIEMTINTNIHSYVKVGQEVASTDSLIVFEESPLELIGEDPDLVARLRDLNKFAPRAGHTGTVVKIDVLYKAAVKDMSKSVQDLIKETSIRKNARAEIAKDCVNSSSFNESKQLIGVEKVGMTDLTEETVVVKFYIKQTKTMNPGDKLFFDSSLKSVCAEVYPEAIKTEDGMEVWAATSARGILGRLIASPFLSGIGNLIVEKLENKVLDIWDGKE